MTDTPTQSSAVTRKIAANALAKLQAGKSITASEREALEQIEREQAAAKNPAPKRSSFGDAVRWTVDKASIEFAIDTKTLVSRLRRLGTLAGEDGKYSTAQVCAAVFGDLRQAQTRLAAAQADAAEVELAKVRGEVVPVADAVRVVQNMFQAVRRIILTSELTHEKQDACIRELEGLKEKDFTTPV